MVLILKSWSQYFFQKSQYFDGGTLGVVIMHSTQNFNMCGAGFEYNTYSKNFLLARFISIYYIAIAPNIQSKFWKIQKNNQEIGYFNFCH